MHTLIWAERKISQIAFQVLLKNKNLKSVRKQKKIRAKSVKIWLYINGCGSRPEKIAVATKQSTGLFLPNSHFALARRIRRSLPQVQVLCILNKKRYLSFGISFFGRGESGKSEQLFNSSKVMVSVCSL